MKREFFLEMLEQMTKSGVPLKLAPEDVPSTQNPNHPLSQNSTGVFPLYHCTGFRDLDVLLLFLDELQLGSPDLKQGTQYVRDFKEVSIDVFSESDGRLNTMIKTSLFHRAKANYADVAELTKLIDRAITEIQDHCAEISDWLFLIIACPQFFSPSTVVVARGKLHSIATYVYAEPKELVLTPQ